MGRAAEEEEDQPCRACTDFKSWAKEQKSNSSSTHLIPTSKPKEPVDCPLDKGELGNHTWGFLHTMASYYPKQATKQQATDMAKFFEIFSQFYPCEPCALDFQQDIKAHPPKTKTRDELAKWLCERHNTVNLKLDKPLFDCSKVHERWKDGWADGSCN